MDTKYCRGTIEFPWGGLVGGSFLTAVAAEFGHITPHHTPCCVQSSQHSAIGSLSLRKVSISEYDVCAPSTETPKRERKKEKKKRRGGHIFLTGFDWGQRPKHRGTATCLFSLCRCGFSSCRRQNAMVCPTVGFGTECTIVEWVQCISSATKTKESNERGPLRWRGEVTCCHPTNPINLDNLVGRTFRSFFSNGEEWKRRVFY